MTLRIYPAEEIREKFISIKKTKFDFDIGKWGFPPSTVIKEKKRLTI